jgi:hypothetical protein
MQNIWIIQCQVVAPTSEVGIANILVLLVAYGNTRDDNKPTVVHYEKSHSFGCLCYCNTLPHCVNWHSWCIQDTQQCCTMTQCVTLVVFRAPVCLERFRYWRMLVSCCIFCIVWETDQYNGSYGMTQYSLVQGYQDSRVTLSPPLGKCWYPWTRLHSVITQKIPIWIFTAEKTSNPSVII